MENASQSSSVEYRKIDCVIIDEDEKIVVRIDDVSEVEFSKNMVTQNWGARYFISSRRFGTNLFYFAVSTVQITPTLR